MIVQLQCLYLFMLAIPVACIAWTVTHEEVFREIKEYCDKCVRDSKTILRRKFFYLFTCEYCFSHYVTILILVLTGFRLLLNDWRGYILAGFSIVWIANVYMSLYALIRTDLKKERTEIKLKEEQLDDNHSS